MGEKHGVSNRSLVGTGIYAGAAIGLGAIARILVGGTLGALLFSIGLLTVCYFDLSLYTGKICYPKSFSFTNYTVMYVCNIIGATAVAGLIRCTKHGRFIMEAATDIMQTKCHDHWLSLIILGFFCNCCIFIAVEIFKTHVGMERVLMTMVAIIVFILCGFEHSIANFAYLVMSNESTLRLLDVIKVIVCVTAGNTIGGLVMSLGITGYNQNVVR